MGYMYLYALSLVDIQRSITHPPLGLVESDGARGMPNVPKAILQLPISNITYLVACKSYVNINYRTRYKLQ